MRYATPSARRCQRDLNSLSLPLKNGCTRGAKGAPDIVSPVKVRYKNSVLFRLFASLVLILLISLSAFDPLQAAASEFAIASSQSVHAPTTFDSSDDIRVHHWRPLALQTVGFGLPASVHVLKAAVSLPLLIPYDVFEPYLLQRVLLL